MAQGSVRPMARGLGCWYANVPNFRGQNIRIAVPATECDHSHLEFFGKSFPPETADADFYCTSFCSVIGGVNIRVAPQVILEPIVVMASDFKTTAEILVGALAICLQNPPAILCLTLSFPLTGSPRSALRTLISELVQREVLVLAAAAGDQVSHRKGSR